MADPVQQGLEFATSSTLKGAVIFGRTSLRNGYILVEHAHVSGVEEVIDRIDEAAALIAAGGPPRLLVDARHFLRNWRVDQSADIADAVRERLPEETRIAILMSREGLPRNGRPVTESLQADDRPVETFLHPGEALAWLGVESDAALD